MPESLRKVASDRTIADELRFRLKILLWATVLIYAVVITTGFVGWWVNHQQTNKTKNALCSLRADLQRRVESAQAFLVRFPNGLDGISRADLLKSIADTQKSINSLDVLDCPDF